MTAEKLFAEIFVGTIEFLAEKHGTGVDVTLLALLGGDEKVKRQFGELMDLANETVKGMK